MTPVKGEFDFVKLLDKLSRIINSNRFTWFIIVLFIFQAAWIALSFRFPMIYDETAHFDLIQTYSEQLSPYTEETPANMTVQVSLSHYLLSFVYRLTQLVTNDLSFHIIVMRLINIGMFAFGLYLVAALMKKIHVKTSYINAGLLFFTLLPLSPLIAATINYDNMLFPLTILYLIIAVDILSTKDKLDWGRVLTLLTVGSLASLAKYTFLPVFGASLLAIGIYFIFARRQVVAKSLKAFPVQARSLMKGKQLIFLILAGVVIGLFSLTYVRNFVIYGSIKPSCIQLLSTKECRSNGIIKRNQDAQATASQRPVGNILDFSKIWSSNMITMTTMTGNSTAVPGKTTLRKPLPLMKTMLYVGIVVSVVALAYAWRSLDKSIGWHFLLLMFVALVISVYAVNAISYYKLHAAYANQPRYILSLIPIFMIMSVAALGYMLRHARILKWTMFVLALAVFTQGGGLVTHIIRSDSSWYWDSEAIKYTNKTARNILQPIVKE